MVTVTETGQCKCFGKDINTTHALLESKGVLSGLRRKIYYHGQLVTKLGHLYQDINTISSKSG